VSPIDPGRYATLVFDCDGVILDSNKVKTDAFYQAALPFGESSARALVEYNRSNGGISRYRKFEYFIDKIIGQPVEPAALEPLVGAYARIVRAGLLTCPVAPDLGSLRRATHGRWLVVSGGDQGELREVFDRRELTRHFDGGIFGSPAPKDAIVEREMQNGNIVAPALYLGDSAYDYSVARHAGMDFVFVSAWSEFSDWKAHQLQHSYYTVANLAELLAARRRD